MEKYYLGIDIGSISTKAVVINSKNKLIAKCYLWTEGNPIQAVKNVLEKIKKQTKKIKISSVGVTGSARELIGKMIKAEVIKNEITAHAIGTMAVYPEVNTILEIGGQDSKIILIKNKIITDYAMNTLCAAGTGAFLIAQSKRLGIPIEKFGEFALKSKSPSKIAGRCTVFAESDLVHKAQSGHKKEDLVAGLCKAVVINYLNNVGKGKKINSPIVFQGGVSKNVGVVQAFEKELSKKVIVDENGHLMGCIGAAILAKESKKEGNFSFDIKDFNFQSKNFECNGCPNNCELIYILKNEEFIDAWGNRCPAGLEKLRIHLEKQEK